MVELGLDTVALAGHVEFGKDGEGLLELLLLRESVALRRINFSPNPIARAKATLVSQLGADVFLLLEQS